MSIYKTEHFWIRRIPNNKWQEIISNVSVMRRTKLPWIEAPLFQTQMGHAVQMHNIWLHNQLFISELLRENDWEDVTKHRYKNNLISFFVRGHWSLRTGSTDNRNTILKECNMDLCTFETMGHCDAFGKVLKMLSNQITFLAASAHII